MSFQDEASMNMFDIICSYTDLEEDWFLKLDDHIDSPVNGFTLASPFHDFFDNFYVSLEPQVCNPFTLFINFIFTHTPLPRLTHQTPLKLRIGNLKVISASQNLTFLNGLTILVPPIHHHLHSKITLCLHLVSLSPPPYSSPCIMPLLVF